MNFRQRAFASLSRQKGKTCLLFAIIFILGNVIAATTAIQQSSKNVEKNIKQQLGTIAAISYNQTVLTDENYRFSDDDKLSQRQVEAVGQLPYVDYYEFSDTYIPGTQKEIKPYILSDMANGLIFRGSPLVNLSVWLRGASLSQFVDLREGKITLKEGRTFTEEELKTGAYVGLVSDRLAETNHYQLGDTIVYDTNLHDYDENGDEIATPFYTTEDTFEIIGIYELEHRLKSKFDHHGDRSNDIDDRITQEILYSTIYTPNKTIQKMCSKQEKTLGEVDDSAELNPNYVLKSPDDVEAFRQEANAILGEPWEIVTSADLYASISGNVETLNELAKKVLYFSIAAALIIISLVVLLFIRDRQSEMGIYLALGEKRQKILGQIFLETVLIAFLAISCSVFTGNYVAQNIATKILNTEMETTDNPHFTTSQHLSGQFLDEEDVVEGFQLEIRPEYVLVLYLVAGMTILLSIIFPLAYLFRLRPKEILL